MSHEQTEQHEYGEEGVIVGRSGHDAKIGERSEQQPQETGESSAPPASAQSGIGASGVPEETGANGALHPGGSDDEGPQE